MDLAVGAPGDDDGGTNRGAVWILFLNADGTVKAEQKISDTAGAFAGVLDDGDQVGWSLAGLGDLDGDGIGDLAAGAVGDDDGGSGRGAAWILFLNADGTVKGEQKISTLEGGFTGTLDTADRFGTSAGALGDLDGDGLSDLAVGAELDDDGGADRGAVWNLFLNADGTVKAHQKVSSTEGGFTGALDNGDRLGCSLASPGDLDGDGFRDLAAGARMDDDGGTDRGAAWILFLEGSGPPLADFSGTPTSGVWPLGVSFSDLSTGGVTARSWTFGDGGTSSATNPSHTYAAAGSFSVSLTATGPAGTDTETKPGYIVVSEPPPVAEFSGAPTSGIRPLSVSFTDLTSGGPVTSRSWTFGDGGSSTATNPSHAYAAAGSYTVSLTATGPGGTDSETKAGYIVVSEPPPVADFSGTPTGGKAPLSVAFTDLSSGPVTVWSWDFGDGGTSSVQDPTHVYGAPGTYTVSLTATGPGGADTETKVDYVEVRRRARPGTTPAVTVLAPAEADFFGRPLSGSAPLTVDFREMSRGTWSRFDWTFGDGGTSTLENPAHIYTTPGLYTVSLTVSRNQGAVTDTETKLGYILVTP